MISKKTVIPLFLGIIATTVLLTSLPEMPSTDLFSTPSRLLNQVEGEKARDSICSTLGSDVKTGSVVSQAERDRWEKNQERLANSRGNDNKLKKYLKGEEDIMPFVLSVVVLAGVFFVFFFLSIIGFFCYITCCVCEKCCPPCKICIKKCKKEDEYKGLGLYWPAVGSLISMIWIFGTCAAGLAYASGLQDSFNTFFCMSITAVYGLNYGDSDTDFLGIAGVAQALDDFANEEMDGITANTAATFTGTPEWVTYEEDELDYILTEMKGVCDGTSDCAECTGQASSYTGGVLPAGITVSCTAGDWDAVGVTSLDYTNALDGSTTPSSIFFSSSVWGNQCDGIQTLYQGTIAGIKTAIDGIEASALSINEQTTTIKETILSGAADMWDISDSLSSQMTSMSDTHSNLEGIMAGFTGGLVALYWIFMFVSLIIIVCGVFLFWKKVYCLRAVLHVFWFIFSFFMIFTFLLTTVFMAISISGEQMCEVLDEMFNDLESFQSYKSIVSGGTAEKISICKRELNEADGPYGGDDNLAKAFDIDKQLADIENMKASITSFNEEAGSDSQTMADLQEIPNQIDTLTNNLETLETTSAFEGVDDHTQLSTTLSGIETDMDACLGYQADSYKADQGDCSGGTADTFATAAADQSAAYCLWIQDTIGASGRYAGCAALLTDIGNVETWVGEKDRMVALKTLQTADLKTQLQQVISLQTDYIDSVSNYNNAVISSLDKISGSDGLLNNIRCFWFGTQLDNMYDAMCVSFVNNVYELAFTSGFFSFGMYFGSFFLFMTARRMAHNKRIEKKKHQQVKGEEEAPMTYEGAPVDSSKQV